MFMIFMRFHSDNDKEHVIFHVQKVLPTNIQPIKYRVIVQLPLGCPLEKQYKIKIGKDFIKINLIKEIRVKAQTQKPYQENDRTPVEHKLTLTQKRLKYQPKIQRWVKKMPNRQPWQLWFSNQ